MKRLICSLILILGLVSSAFCETYYGCPDTETEGTTMQLLEMKSGVWHVIQGNGSKDFKKVNNETQTEDGVIYTIVSFESKDNWMMKKVSSNNSTFIMVKIRRPDGHDYDYCNVSSAPKSVPTMSSIPNPYMPYNPSESLEQMNQRFQRENSRLTCTACNGTGRCPVCHGSGRYTSYGYTQDPCSGCGGDGKCFHCHGSGKLYN